MTSPASFENVREKWFPEVHHHCPGVPCLIVGTQVDLRDDPGVKDKLSKQKMQPVRKEDGERMAKELGAVKYVECSALTQYKLKDVFDEVSRSFCVFGRCQLNDIGSLRSDMLISDDRQLWPLWSPLQQQSLRSTSVWCCKRACKFTNGRGPAEDRLISSPLAART